MAKVFNQREFLPVKNFLRAKILNRGITGYKKYIFARQNFHFRIFTCHVFVRAISEKFSSSRSSVFARLDPILSRETGVSNYIEKSKAITFTYVSSILYISTWMQLLL